jgi:hypothetical protein
VIAALYASGDPNPYMLSEVTHWRELPALPSPSATETKDE